MVRDLHITHNHSVHLLSLMISSHDHEAKSSVTAPTLRSSSKKLRGHIPGVDLGEGCDRPKTGGHSRLVV